MGENPRLNFGLDLLYLSIRIFVFNNQMKNGSNDEVSGLAFYRAAKSFGLLTTSVRLRIIGALCRNEKNVTQLLDEIDVSQPSTLRHLNVLCRTGVAAQRLSGVQVFYRTADE